MGLTTLGGRSTVEDMTTPAAHPVHVHDCDTCVFLGTWVTTEYGARVEYDLYKHENLPTYVARYSSQDSDYTSGLVFVGLNPAITEAHRLATEQGIAFDVVGAALSEPTLPESTSEDPLRDLAILLGVDPDSIN